MLPGYGMTVVTVGEASASELPAKEGWSIAWHLAWILSMI